MRLGSPYGPRSHTFPRLPHTTAMLPKSRHWLRRDQHFRPRKLGADPVSTNSLRLLPARYRMSRRGINSAGTSVRFTQTYASDRLTQIPRSCDEGGMGMAPLRDAAASTSGGWAARRLRVGLKAGPGTAARLEAGNCGEGFACLSRVCAVLPHQACADGSVFFCRQPSKAGLSGCAHHLWLVPDPDSQP